MGRQVDSACRESERKSQAGSQQLYWDCPLGPKVSCLFPYPFASLSSPPEALCRQKRPPSTCPHTHTCKYPYPMREQYYAHQQATDGCASVRRHCKSEILKGKSSMVILSLGLFWLCVCVCVCVCVCMLSGHLQDSLISWLSDVRIADNRSTLNNLSVHLIRSTYLQKLLSLSLIHCSEDTERRDVWNILGLQF